MTGTLQVAAPCGATLKGRIGTIRLLNPQSFRPNSAATPGDPGVRKWSGFIRGVTNGLIAVLLLGGSTHTVRGDAPDDITASVLRLFKSKCVKCHGPIKSEGQLNLASAAGVAFGGESGAVVVPGDAAQSMLWQRIADDEMPPTEPLLAEERQLIKSWIERKAPGLPAEVSAADLEHGAFRKLRRPPVSSLSNASSRTPIDGFVTRRLQQAGLTLNSAADRNVLVRRATLLVTGLPPRPEDIELFLNDKRPDAYSRLVQRLLASPHYGERWGQFWLDAAGYADSNGYFSADTDRPLAYRYRDYVIRSFNADKPFDQFVTEQLAGDELAGFVPGQDATPEVIELLEATHFLRNGQDGTDSSDGNPDERRVDRFAALESPMQIVATSLMGLTVQCAKCHDHKFEPISQQQYYEFQAVFYPALPAAHRDRWVKPGDRYVYAALPGKFEQWQAERQQLEQQLAASRKQLRTWADQNHPPGEILFSAAFDDPSVALATHWNIAAHAEERPGGNASVHNRTTQQPGTRLEGGQLEILDRGTDRESWISTRQRFDWTPDVSGAWAQVTFELVRHKVDKEGGPAKQIGYLIAIHNSGDGTQIVGENILIEGKTGEEGAQVQVDKPGDDSQLLGKIGEQEYEPGRIYGVRVTNTGQKTFLLQHLVDRQLDGKGIEVSQEDLPDGSFGFADCSGSNFVVDNVVISRSPADDAGAFAETSVQFETETAKRRKVIEKQAEQLQTHVDGRPGKLAWVSDVSDEPLDVFRLDRGNYNSPTEKVTSAPFTFLSEANAVSQNQPASEDAPTAGRRLTWARWVTESESRAAALMARVQVNRMWQHYFRAGIVATTENLGVSGAPPANPELLDYLAARLIDSGWSMKAVHRDILLSGLFRQSSDFDQRAYDVDPENSLLWRFPLQRLDAETIRDSILAVSGELDLEMGGRYVATQRLKSGEVAVPESAEGAHRRSIYLRRRRTQVPDILSVFDAPRIVFSCTQRNVSTTSLQSLALLNSQFNTLRARQFAERLKQENGQTLEKKLRRAYRLAFARAPTSRELQAGHRFLAAQSALAQTGVDAEVRAWSDYCQMLISTNEFLYVE
jgi:mono/diheme cytochrome c family protein